MATRGTMGGIHCTTRCSGLRKMGRRERLASGKAAFYRGWVSDYSLISSYLLPRNATRFGITSVPGGKAGRASTLGGNGLTVSRASAHPREALELIRFLRRRDVRLRRAPEYSEPPKERELCELPSILEP